MPVVTRKRCHSDLLQQNLPRGTVDWKLSVAIPLAPHCVHAEVMPSPCCPPPPLIDGCIRVRPFSNMSTVWRATSARGWPSISLGKAFSGPWFSAWPTLPPRLPSQMSHLHHPTCPFLLPLPLSFIEISPYVFLVQLIFSWPLGGPELTEHPPTKY